MNYNALSPEEKVQYLVNHKGEMSVTLWNDRAQCIFGFMQARIKELENGLAWYADSFHINFADDRYENTEYQKLPVFVKDVEIDEVETGARARAALRGVKEDMK
jgi:hypothetical protein